MCAAAWRQVLQNGLGEALDVRAAQAKDASGIYAARKFS